MDLDYFDRTDSWGLPDPSERHFYGSLPQSFSGCFPVSDSPMQSWKGRPKPWGTLGTLVPDTVMIDFERYLKTASGTLVPDTVRTLVPDTVMIDFEHYLKTASGKAFARERLLRTWSSPSALPFIASAKTEPAIRSVSEKWACHS
jgi:hypothetical protein